MCNVGMELLRLFGSIVDTSGASTGEKDEAEGKENDADTQAEEAGADAGADTGANAAAATTPPPPQLVPRPLVEKPWPLRPLCRRVIASMP